MPMYRISYTTETLKCNTYRQCPDISNLAIHLNWMLNNNPKITINKVEVTKNYISTGQLVKFLPWEYKSQYFIEDLKHRLLTYHMELKSQTT